MNPLQQKCCKGLFFCCRISPKKRRLNAFDNKQARCPEKGGCEYTFFYISLQSIRIFFV